MSNQHFLVELKTRFKSHEDWPSLLFALEHDATIWKALTESEIGRRALKILPPSIKVWSPAMLSMLAVDEGLQLDSQAFDFASGISEGTREKANNQYAEWLQLPPEVELSLDQVGLCAIALCDRVQSLNSWSQNLNNFPPSLNTVLACCFGMVSDPLDMVSELFQPDDQRSFVEPAIHAILSNPIPEGELVQLFIRVLQSFPQSAQAAILMKLTDFRPILAEAVVTKLLEIDDQVSDTSLREPASSLERVDILRTQSKLVKVAGNPAKSITFLAEAFQTNKRNQAQIAADVARSAQAIIWNGTGEQYHVSENECHKHYKKVAFEAWKQAVALHPEEIIYRAGLIHYLIMTNQLEEAKAALFSSSISQNQEDDNPAYPVFLLFSSLISSRTRDIQKAKTEARIAMQRLKHNQFVAGIFLEQIGHPVTIPQHFMELELYEEAKTLVEAIVMFRTGDPALLTILTKTYLELADPEKALNTAYLTCAQRPESSDFKRLLIRCLEEAGEWQSAYEELYQLIEHEGQAQTSDQNCLAFYALNSNAPEQTINLCQQVLNNSPEALEDDQKGIAYWLIGEAYAQKEEHIPAVEAFGQAIYFAPGLIDPWFSITKLNQQENNESGAIDTLRAAIQAVPNAPELHLALGQTYFHENAPTQALAHFKIVQTQIDEKSKKSIILARLPRFKSGNDQNLIPGTNFPRRILSLKLVNDLYLGKTCYQLGHFQEACRIFEPYYQRGSNIKKNDPEMTFTYALTLIALGEKDRATPFLEYILEMQPENKIASLEYARIQINSNMAGIDYQLVVQLLQKLLATSEVEKHRRNSSMNENNFGGVAEVSLDEAQALLAEALAKQGDYPNSAKEYKKALKSQLIKDPAWQSRLSAGFGRASLAIGEPETAIAALQESIRLDSFNPYSHRSLSEAYFAARLIESSFQSAYATMQLNPEDLDTLDWFAAQGLRLHQEPGGTKLYALPRVLHALEQATRIAPERADFYVRMGEVCIMVDNLPAAKLAFSKLASLPNASRDDLKRASNNLMILDDPSSAIRLLERAIHENPSDAYDLYLDLAHTQEKAGNIALAIQSLNHAISLQENDTNLYLYKTNLLMGTGQPQAALNCIETALRVEPNNSELHLHQARLLREVGKLSESFRQIETYIHLDSESTDMSQEISARTFAAELAIALLHPLKAIEMLEACPTGHNDIEALLLHTELALNNDHVEQAEQLLDQIARQDDTHPRYLAAQARVLARSQGFDSAIHSQTGQRLIQCIQKDNYPVLVLYALSEAALELGLWKNALALARQLLGKAPHEPLSYLHMAKCLVLSAENQILCQESEIITHAPGAAALATDNWQSFEFAIQTAELLLQNLDLYPEQGNNAPGLIDRWKARGLAIFHPCQEHAKLVTEIINSGFYGPDDLAALIRCNRYCQTDIEAVEHTDAHPLVLLQNALSNMQQDPKRAWGMVSRILEPNKNVEHSWGSQPPIVHHLKARVAFRLNDYETAYQSIQEALASWPNEPRWHSFASEISLNSRSPDFPTIIDHLEQAIRLEPMYSDHYVKLGSVLLLNNQGKHALHVLEQANSIAPENPQIWLSLARIHQAEDDLNEAERCATIAVEYSLGKDVRTEIEALKASAEIALQAGNPGLAHQQALAIIKLDPNDADGFCTLSRCLEALKQPKMALEALENALPMVNQSLPLRMERVRLLRATEGLESAIKSMLELVEEYPEEPILLAQLAEMFAETGQGDNAVSLARQALQVNLGSLDIDKQARLHYLIGRQLRKTGQLDQAIYHLNAAIHLSPRWIELYLELGRAHQDRRQVTQALKTYQQAIKIDGSDFRPYYQAGLALKESKDYLEAESMLRRAAQLAPQEVSVHRMLAAVVALNLVHNRRNTS